MKGQVNGPLQSADDISRLALQSKFSAIRQKQPLAVATGIGLIVVFLLSLLWINTKMLPLPQFLIVYNTVVIVLYLVAALLFYSRLRRLKQWSCLVLAAAFLFTSLLVGVHNFSFTNAFSKGNLIGDSQTSAWLWLFWHLLFPFFIMLYTVFTKQEQQYSARKSVGHVQTTVVFIVIVLIATGLTVICLQAEQFLPQIISESAYQPTIKWIVLLIGLPIYATSLFLLFSNNGLRRPIDAWLAVALVALLIEMLLGGLIKERYNLGFFESKIYGLLSIVFVINVLFKENVRLYEDTEKSIHEKQVAETSLYKSEALLLSVFKISPIGLGFNDMNGQFIIQNDEMLRFLPSGKIPSADEKQQHRWKAFNDDGTLVEKTNYPGMRALRGDPVTPFLEMIYLNDEGKETWTRVASLPLRDEKNEIVGAVTVITDIDELKRTTEALKQNEQQLKILLNKRDEFIGVASHELKTPITSIKGYAEMVQKRLEAIGNEEDSALLKRLNKQIDRLTSLINNLLDTTRIAEGIMSLTTEPFQLNDLLKERMVEMQSISRHHLVLEAEPIATVTGDKERIGQVLVNFLSNAIKYSAPESTIIVRSQSIAGAVKVSVIDQGIGISEEEQGKVFDRFFRAKMGNSDFYPGIGLGLYISAQIIQRHGGTVQVNSELGKGSEFSFTLPC